MDDREEHETHESYVMVQFSRRQGNPGRLFGSSLRYHESYVTLKVARAERVHSLGYDKYHAGSRGDVVEVDLSAAQFAELLTTMNVGSGVPATLRYVNGQKVADPPDVALEVEKVREGFKQDMGKLAAKCKDDIREVEELLGKKSFTQSDREVILKKFRKVMMEVESNTPFMLSQFEEATEKVVQHAKAEVDAFVSHNVMAEGLRSLKERAEAEAGAPQLLPKKEEA